MLTKKIPFLDGIEPFLTVISPCGTLQNVVLRFLIYAPLTPKMYSPKFALWVIESVIVYMDVCDGSYKGNLCTQRLAFRWGQTWPWVQFS